MAPNQQRIWIELLVRLLFHEAVHWISGNFPDKMRYTISESFTVDKIDNEAKGQEFGRLRQLRGYTTSDMPMAERMKVTANIEEGMLMELFVWNERHVAKATLTKRHHWNYGLGWSSWEELCPPLYLDSNMQTVPSKY